MHLTHHLDLACIRAISLDLDDTLWPITHAIECAEHAVHQWLVVHAPATAQMCAGPAGLRRARDHMLHQRPDWRLDLNGLRRESLRWTLVQAGDDPALAEPAFDVFVDARHSVDWFDGAQQAIATLAARYPLVAVTNGNADLHRMGMAHHFVASLNAPQLGIQKPDTRIFLAAAERLGVRPEQVLHIGDDALSDVWGALQAGMQTVWINPHALAWPYTPQVVAQAQHHAATGTPMIPPAQATNVESVDSSANASAPAANPWAALFSSQLTDYIDHAHPDALYQPHATVAHFPQVCDLLQVDGA